MLSTFGWEMPVEPYPTDKDPPHNSVQRKTQIFERDPTYVELLIRLQHEQWLNSAKKKATAAGKHIERSKLVEEATPVVQELQSSHSKLESIVERHERLIQQRWLNPKHKQAWRESKLRKALSGIPEVDRPDVEHFFNLSKALRRSAKEKESIKQEIRLPMLNINLAEVKSTFLMFLKSRARNHPARFILRDVLSLHMACHIVIDGLTDPSANDVWVIKNPEQAQYTGDWFNYQYALRVFKDFFSEEVKSPTFLTHDKYLMALEQANKILKFLISVCHEILCDQTKPLTDRKCPIEAEPSLPQDTMTFEPQMDELVRDATYGKGDLDITELGRNVRGRYEKACSDLWAAREQPSFFHSRLLQARDSYHMVQKSKSTFERKLVTPTVLDKTDWIEIMRLTLHNLLLPVLVWQELDTHLQAYIEATLSSAAAFKSRVQREKTIDAKFQSLWHALRNLPFPL